MGNLPAPQFVVKVGQGLFTLDFVKGLEMTTITSPLPSPAVPGS
jgi:hypothetical protein